MWKLRTDLHKRQTMTASEVTVEVHIKCTERLRETEAETFRHPRGNPLPIKVKVKYLQSGFLKEPVTQGNIFTMPLE